MNFKKMDFKKSLNMDKIKKNFLSIIAVLNDKTLYHFAASLSFHSVLALIPFLFISLSVFMQMPSFEEHAKALQDFIASALLPTNAQQFSHYVEGFLANSNKLGIFGVIAMIFTTLMFFTDFEFVITRLSNTKPRSFFARLCIYWTLLTLMPLGLAFSLWLSHYFADFVRGFGFDFNLLEIVPYIIIWAIFGVTYGACVNCSLKLRDVVLSSFLASIGWHISKLLFISYAFYNQNYASIYGSLSILLFFFLWLYVSWIVFLFGLKLLCALSEQNVEKKA